MAVVANSTHLSNQLVEHKRFVYAGYEWPPNQVSIQQLEAMGYAIAPEAYTAAGLVTPPPRPITGRPDPKPIKGLMEMPSRVNDVHVELAHRILGSGSSYALRRRRAKARAQSLKDRLAGKQPRWKLLYENYVQLAVEKQWRLFAPARFLELCQVLDKSDRGNTLVVREHLVRSYYGVNKDRLRRDYYVTYKCPSTGKTYVSGVPEAYIELRSSTPPHRRIGELSADKAMAWKLRLKLKEYHELKVEA